MPLTPEDVRLALETAQTTVEIERRDRFKSFDVDASCLWPASHVFHQHSALGPAWRPALSVNDVEELTYNGAYRSYPGKPRFALPSPVPLDAALEATVRARRSRSVFDARAVALGDVAKVLAMGCGITATNGLSRRAAPSGGALYPVEAYLLAFNVAHLASGSYHYLAQDHVLEQLAEGTSLHDAKAFLPPGLASAGPALMIVLSAVFARTQAKYLERGYRFALLEAGHVVQNMLLASTALGLAACPVGGFWDDPLNSLLGFDGTTEAALYGVVIGEDSK